MKKLRGKKKKRNWVLTQICCYKKEGLNGPPGRISRTLRGFGGHPEKHWFRTAPCAVRDLAPTPNSIQVSFPVSTWLLPFLNRSTVLSVRIKGRMAIGYYRQPSVFAIECSVMMVFKCIWLYPTRKTTTTFYIHCTHAYIRKKSFIKWYLDLQHALHSDIFCSFYSILFIKKKCRP